MREQRVWLLLEKADALVLQPVSLAPRKWMMLRTMTTMPVKREFPKRLPKSAVVLVSMALLSPYLHEF